MPTNQAAWLDGKAEKLRVAEAEMPKAGDDDIVIKVFATAVNPVDWKIQDSGYFIKTWPMVLGCDAAGEVVEVGSNAAKRFKKGDRVTGHTTSLLSQKPADGAFQSYARLSPNRTAHLPSSTTFASGSVLPLALDTAAVGLYSAHPAGLALPQPSLHPQPSGKTVLVWGGSSSVGALAIQLAVASGAKVVATASKHNFDFCKSCGASEVWDYSSPSIIDDVVASIKTLGGSFAGVYDAIGEQEKSYHAVLPICEKLGGGTVATVMSGPEKVPENVKIAQVFGINDSTAPIWEGYVTSALEQGKLRCLPEPMVVGKGLESVQAGLDANKKGVSAKKVVVQLD
ncbi:hypothetical protein LTR62_004800 [Meristemomyces frigidus]|uniref:Enoyl reductase (ER) domain-containing protein n=1 Tax=Meristemomyces frigidus TaxID=1508187 RepID=A0AAN7TFI8_9PEZI|nr:hypothetical protein LTR62_004800 [Meristemomyces frigidus]